MNAKTIHNEFGWLWYPIRALFTPQRWAQNDTLSRFMVYMLLPGIPASLVAAFTYGELTALTFLIWWVGVVVVSSMIIKRWLM